MSLRVLKASVVNCPYSRATISLPHTYPPKTVDWSTFPPARWEHLGAFFGFDGSIWYSCDHLYPKLRMGGNLREPHALLWLGHHIGGTLYSSAAHKNCKYARIEWYFGARGEMLHLFEQLSKVDCRRSKVIEHCLQWTKSLTSSEQQEFRRDLIHLREQCRGAPQIINSWGAFAGTFDAIAWISLKSHIKGQVALLCQQRATLENVLCFLSKEFPKRQFGVIRYYEQRKQYQIILKRDVIEDVAIALLSKGLLIRRQKDVADIIMLSYK